MKYSLPVVPLRDLVLFPSQLIVKPLLIGREQSMGAVNKAIQGSAEVFFVTQIDPKIEKPSPKDLNKIGVVGTVTQVIRLSEDNIKIVVKAGSRAVALSYEEGVYLTADVETIDSETEEGERIEALKRGVIEKFKPYINSMSRGSSDLIKALEHIINPGELADYIASYVALPILEKQELLEEVRVSLRLERLYSFLLKEAELAVIEKDLNAEMKKNIDQDQRKYYLNSKLKAIRELLSKESLEEESFGEIKALEKKAEAINLSEEAREKVQAETKKLKTTPMASAEAGPIRTWINTVLGLPWNIETKDQNDLEKSRQILNANHIGMDEPKSRVLEFLALIERRAAKLPLQNEEKMISVKEETGAKQGLKENNSNLSAPILCFVGPPGVGKTSLAASIAQAMGRSYVRISLGGVRDEAEIRGHRRTYLASMPGKIIQALKKAGSSNPVIVLDEIDKLGSDYRGDPAAALLEVLDPEQNKHFIDHYLEVEFDLSKVMFIATANTVKTIPRPLLDRMDVIYISGYTEEEKLQIARDYAIPKLMNSYLIGHDECVIEDEAILGLIHYYTRESGVRSLTRKIAELMRKSLIALAKLKPKQSTNPSDRADLVTSENTTPETKSDKLIINFQSLSKYLGAHKYDITMTEEDDMVGVSNGLAYTEVGGDLLHVESLLIPGRGKIKYTGQLGEVMQESVKASYSYIRSRALDFGINPEKFDRLDIHVHVPEGATPKDGPSAGVAICTSLVSALTNIPANRKVAMTGEITLRGRVTAIGGLKEKLLAALRAGIETVIIPASNVKNLEDIPAQVKAKLQIIPVSRVDEALNVALIRSPLICPIGSVPPHIFKEEDSNGDKITEQNPN